MRRWLRHARMACGWAVAAFCSPLAASPLTLAGIYHPDVALSQYWVSEKYDGVRAHWTGTQLLSRQGLPLDAPPWFTAGWPTQALDGELWAGRGQFAQLQSTVAQAPPDHAAWRRVRYMVFDLPGHPGDLAARYAQLRPMVAALQQPWVEVVPQWQVDSHPALQRQLRQLTQQGAEGLMLRRVDAPYRGGRSNDLLKLKLYEDAEATVVAHLPGRGKYQGLTGALLVQQADGLQFKLGSGLSDAQRRTPPPVGSTVTYRFNGRHPSGVPRFARFERVRALPADNH